MSVTVLHETEADVVRMRGSNSILKQGSLTGVERTSPSQSHPGDLGWRLAAGVTTLSAHTNGLWSQSSKDSSSW